VGTSLVIGLAATLMLLIPGAVVALTWKSDPSDTDDGPLFHILLALGWGFGVVPYLAFCYALFSKEPLTPWVTATTAILVTLCALVFWWMRRDRVVPAHLTGKWKESVPVLLACFAVALIYLLKYDRSVFFLESCIHRVVMQTLQLTDVPIDILASNQDDQRLGNTAVISNFVVLYRGLGFRVLYAFVGFIMALGGYLLGRRLFQNKHWGWFALVALPLNPYVAKIPLLDENLLTLGYCSLFLPFMFRNKIPWGHVGALFGLAIMMRHISILSGPAMLWAVWQYQGDRRKALAWGLGTFCLVTLVAHIHHFVALGSVLQFESYGQLNGHLFPHRLLGNHSGLMQWPFSPELVRTPWNPYPTFLMWPVYLAGHWGLILFSALVVGMVVLFRKARTESVFWLLWFVPPYLALSLQENWDVPNKMGVIYIIFHPIVLWIIAGVRAGFREPKRWGVAWVIVTALAMLGMWSIQSMHVKMDERYYVAWKGERIEEIDYVEAERARISTMVLWPDYSRLTESSRLFHPEKWHGLLRDLSNPVIDQHQTPYAWYPGEAVDRAKEPITLVLDLSERLFDRSTPWIRIAPSGAVPDIDLTQKSPPTVIPNLRVDWTQPPVSVLVTGSDADVTAIALIFEPWTQSGQGQAKLQERYERGLEMIMGWGPDGFKKVRRLRLKTHQIVLRVPAGPLGVSESLNNAGQNYLFWKTRLAPNQPIELDGPYRIFHN